MAEIVELDKRSSHRLMTQIARVMAINQLEAITPDLVDAARQILVVGAQRANRATTVSQPNRPFTRVS